MNYQQRSLQKSSTSVLLSSSANASLLQDILNASPGGVAYCEPVSMLDAVAQPGEIADFVYQVVNTRMSLLIGRPVEQIVGQRMTDLSATVVQHGLLDRYKIVQETGQATTFEHALQTDTATSWLQVSVEPVATGIVISLIDITDRKHAELKALQQAAEIRATLDASLNSILLMRAMRDEQGNIVDFRMETANQAVINSLFKTPDELVGKTLLDVFPGNVESGFFDLYARVTDTGQSEKAEYYYQDTNGFTGWFEVSAVRQATDMIVLTFNNVTAQRQEQIGQQQQAQLLEAILDHSQTAISLHKPIYNDQGHIVDFQTVRANRQALINWEPIADAILTQSFLTIRPDARDSDEFARYVRVIETGQPDVFEFSHNKRQYVITIARAGGDIVMSAVDVTTDRQYRADLEALNRTLQQSNESLQSFAYVASHDLQEPLRKIQAFSDMLQTQFEDNLSDGERDMIRRIQKSAKRMQQLVKDLLAYSQITARRDPFQSVILHEVVDETISDLEISIAEANARLVVGNLPTVQGNASRLRQLMQNLITNALKFRHNNRQLVIHLASRPAQPDELPDSLPASTAYWLITVADNGTGFDEKYKDRIFQLFQRLHDATAYSGTGIGLAICQRVAESHNGAIDVSSQLGEGTTFSLFLPVNQEGN